MIKTLDSESSNSMFPWVTFLDDVIPLTSDAMAASLLIPSASLFIPRLKGFSKSVEPKLHTKSKYINIWLIYITNL